MRKLVLMLGLLLPVAIFAQTDYLRYTGKGKVVFANGESAVGIVAYDLFAPGKVAILPENDSKTSRYNSDEVKEFTIDGEHYYSLKTKSGEIKVANNHIFLKSLVPDSFKMKVLLGEAQPPVSTTENVPIVRTYYALMPGDETAYALNELKFTPFKKVAGYLSDCPAIVEKINTKEKGFSLPLVATDEIRLEVFKKVAAEYHSCQK